MRPGVRLLLRAGLERSRQRTRLLFALPDTPPASGYRASCGLLPGSTPAARPPVLNSPSYPATPPPRHRD